MLGMPAAGGPPSTSASAPLKVADDGNMDHLLRPEVLLEHVGRVQQVELWVSELQQPEGNVAEARRELLRLLGHAQWLSTLASPARERADPESQRTDLQRLEHGGVAYGANNAQVGRVDAAEVRDVERLAVDLGLSARDAFVLWLAADETASTFPPLARLYFDYARSNIGDVMVGSTAAQRRLAIARKLHHINRLCGLRVLEALLRLPLLIVPNADSAANGADGMATESDDGTAFAAEVGQAVFDVLYGESGSGLLMKANSVNSTGAPGGLLDCIDECRTELITQDGGAARAVLPVACHCVFYICCRYVPTAEEAGRLLELLIGEGKLADTVGKLRPGADHDGQVRASLHHAMFVLTMAWVTAMDEKDSSPFKPRGEVAIQSLPRQPMQPALSSGALKQLHQLLVGDDDEEEGKWSPERRGAHVSGTHAVLRLAWLFWLNFSYHGAQGQTLDEPVTRRNAMDKDEMADALLGALQQRIFTFLDGVLQTEQTAREDAPGEDRPGDAQERLLFECGLLLDRFLVMRRHVETASPPPNVLPPIDVLRQNQFEGQDCLEQMAALAFRWCIHVPNGAYVFFDGCHPLLKDAIVELASTMTPPRDPSRQPIDMAVLRSMSLPFLRLMTAISRGAQQRQVHDFLLGTADQRQLYPFWSHYLYRLRQFAENTVGANVKHMPAFSQMVLIDVLRLVSVTFCSGSGDSADREAAVQDLLDIYANPRLQDVDPSTLRQSLSPNLPVALMQLVSTSISDIALKGVLLQTLASIAGAANETYVPMMWDMLCKLRICGDGVNGHSITKDLEKESREGSYPVTTSFCLLIDSLFRRLGVPRPPSVVVGAPSISGFAAGGAFDASMDGSRHEHAVQFFDFILEDVVLKLDTVTRQYATSQDKWRVAAAALSVVYNVLEGYNISHGLSGDNSRAEQEELGYKVMHHMLVAPDQPLLRQLLRLLELPSDGDNGQQLRHQAIMCGDGAQMDGVVDYVGEATRRDADEHDSTKLLCLKIMVRTLELQNDFDEMLERWSFSPPARAEKLSPNLLMRFSPQLVKIIQYISYAHHGTETHTEIAHLTVRLLGDVSLKVHEPWALVDELVRHDTNSTIKQSYCDVLASMSHVTRMVDDAGFAQLCSDVMELLLRTLVDTPAPNLAHWLLGLSGPGAMRWHTGVELQVPPGCCLKPILDILMDAWYPYGRLIQQCPRIVEQCQRLLFELCSQPFGDVGTNLLLFLRAGGFFDIVYENIFHRRVPRHFEGLPAEWGLDAGPERNGARLEQYEEHVDSATARCNWCAWSLKLMALAFHVFAQTESNPELSLPLICELFGWNDGAVPERSSMMLLLQAVALHPLGSMLHMEQPDPRIAELLRQCVHFEHVGGVSSEQIDVDEFYALYKEHCLERRDAPDARNFVSYALKWNRHRRHIAAEAHVFEAWRQLTDVAFRCYAGRQATASVDPLRHVALLQKRLYAVLRTVLQKLQRKAELSLSSGNVLPGPEVPPWAMPLGCVTVSLFGLLRHHGERVVLRGGTSDSMLGVPVSDHRDLFEKLVDILVGPRSKPTSFEYRTVLYASFVHYLQYSWKAVEAAPQDLALQRQLRERVAILLQSHATELLHMMTGDATEAAQVHHRALALSAMSSMLSVLHGMRIDAVPRFEHYFERFFAIFNNRQTDMLDSDQARAAAANLYSCTATLLLRIAQMPGGALRLLEHGLLARLAQCDMLQQQATVAVSGRGQLLSAVAAQQPKATPILRLLCGLAVELSENDRFIQQLIELLQVRFNDFAPVFEAILSGRSFSLLHVEEATAIAALLGYIAPKVVGNEPCILQYQHFLLQLLDHIGAMDFVNIHSLGPRGAAFWWNRLQADTAQERADAEQDAAARKPAGIVARTWTVFDDNKLTATVSLLCQVSRFCRLRVPMDAQTDIYVEVERKPLSALARALSSCLSLHAACYQCNTAAIQATPLWAGATNVEFAIENLLSLFHQHVRIWLDFWKSQGPGTSGESVVIGGGVMFQAQMRDDGAHTGHPINVVSITDLCNLFAPNTSEVMAHGAWTRLDVEARPFIQSVRKELNKWYRECGPRAE